MSEYGDLYKRARALAEQGKSAELAPLKEKLLASDLRVVERAEKRALEAKASASERNTPQELLPCPFCGGWPVRETERTFQCASPNCAIGGVRLRNAEQWNTRQTRSEIAHTDHPLRHRDRTCPACQAESAQSATAPTAAEVLDKVIASLKDASERRYQEMKESEAEAEKWKAEDDMYGWNFHIGRAGGMNQSDVIYYRSLRLAEALRREIDAVDRTASR